MEEIDTEICLKKIHKDKKSTKKIIVKIKNQNSFQYVSVMMLNYHSF